MSVLERFDCIKMLSRKEVKFKAKPWFSLGLRTSTNIKNKIYRKFIRTRNQFQFLKFKLYRYKLNHIITLSKRKYYESYFRCNKSSIKNIWKGIKQLVAVKPEAYTTPTKIVTSSNTVLTKASDIANTFNCNFVNVGKSLSQAIPKVDVSFSSFLFNPLPHSFFLSPTSLQEIQDIILSLKSGKASGPFSIPVSLLKSLNSNIAKPLEILYTVTFHSLLVLFLILLRWHVSFLFTSLVLHPLYQTIDQYPFCQFSIRLWKN